MTQTSWRIDPAAVSWAHPGEPDASRVLVLHGFTGSPYSVRPLAQAFAGAGMTVRLPRLPGHGTDWRALNRTTWQDWYSAAERELLALTEDGSRAAVAGLSMGGTLALRLAELHPDRVSGLVLVNPALVIDDPRLRALPLLKHLRAGLSSIGNDIAAGGNEHGYDHTPLRALDSQRRLWALTEQGLPRVTCPLLVFSSRVDHVVPPRNGALLLERVASARREQVWLDNSWHVATLDHDASLIEQRAVAFVQELG